MYMEGQERDDKFHDNPLYFYTWSQYFYAAAIFMKEDLMQVSYRLREFQINIYHELLSHTRLTMSNGCVIPNFRKDEFSNIWTFFPRFLVNNI